MELIAAVYDNWGIGRDGTQPVALKADRQFFREMTRGCLVIAGRRTAADFPGKKPLPGRENLLLTRSGEAFPGFAVCQSLEQAAELAAKADRAVVIGGGSVYRQMLPLCDKAYITKVHLEIACDTFFPNLDTDPAWGKPELLRSGEEAGIRYEMLLYKRK